MAYLLSQLWGQHFILVIVKQIKFKQIITILVNHYFLQEVKTKSYGTCTCSKNCVAS